MVIDCSVIVAVLLGPVVESKCNVFKVLYLRCVLDFFVLSFVFYNDIKRYSRPK